MEGHLIAIDLLTDMHGTIRHRLLLNFGADPEVVAPLLPPPFRPQLVADRAVVGVCLLRLEHLRPRGLPGWLGVGSDNAAHRIAVEWDGDAGVEHGVFVLRRDTAQRLPALVGGRLFPGVHGRARFEVAEDAGGLSIAYRTTDGLSVEVNARPTEQWSSRLFPSADAASLFFECGGRGWSPARRSGLERVELLTPDWRAEPVEVQASASFFEDGEVFSRGSMELDGALLMRDLPVVWRRIPGASPVRHSRI